MQHPIYDLIILGGGCAGLTAAIYAGRANLDTLILETGVLGGQGATTAEIGNYPGTPDITGPELMQKMFDQAKDYGAKYQACQITDIHLHGEQKEVITDAGTFYSRALIIATGAAPRKLGFEGEDKFRGHGVSYCATCDGFFFRDKDIFVIGGGNSAAEEALFLTRFARKVTMLVRRDVFRCEKHLADQILSHPKIEVLFNTELVRAFGEEALNGVELKNNKTGASSTYYVSEEDGLFGIFVFVGYEPASALFKEDIQIDEAGYIVTNDRMETNISGVYAAGDVRQKELRQLVTATADGAIAAVSAEKYIMELPH